MRELFVLGIMLASMQALAQYTPKSPTQGNVSLILPYHMFCADSDFSCKADLIANKKPYEMQFRNANSSGKEEVWNIKFYFGPTLTYYTDSTIQFNLSNDSSFTAHNVPLKQRTSFNFYKKIFTKPEEFYRFIDEPTNMFMLTFEKNNNEISFSFFHPKYKVTWLWDSEEYHNPNVRVSGTHLGEEIDGELPFAQPSSQTPGLPAFPVILDTKGNAVLSIGYGRKIPLVDANKGKRFNLFYTPSILGGINYGHPYVVYAPFDKGEGNGHSWYTGRAEKGGFNGGTFGVHNRLTLSNRKDTFGVSLENGFNYSFKKMNILPSDGPHGTMKMDFGFTTFRLMVTARLFTKKR